MAEAGEILPNRLYTATQVSQILGVSYSKVLNWVYEKKLPARQMTQGGTWFIRGKALSEFLDRMSTPC